MPCGFVCRNPGPDRPMPPRFAQASLDLHYKASDPQQLSGTVGSELGMLTQLQSLYLYGNRLSGTLPKELFRLQGLGAIHIGSNGFSGTLPTQIGLLRKLRTLRLEGNRLSGTLPTELARITDLQFFSVNDNFFNGTIPDALAIPSFQPRTCHLTNTQTQIRRLVGATPNAKPDTNQFECPLPALSPSCLEPSPGQRLVCLGGSVPAEGGEDDDDDAPTHDGPGGPDDDEYDLYTYGRDQRTQLGPSLRGLPPGDESQNGVAKQQMHIGIAFGAAAAVGVSFALVGVGASAAYRRRPRSRIAVRGQPAIDTSHQTVTGQATSLPLRAVAATNQQ